MRRRKESTSGRKIFVRPEHASPSLLCSFCNVFFNYTIVFTSKLSEKRNNVRLSPRPLRLSVISTTSSRVRNLRWEDSRFACNEETCQCRALVLTRSGVVTVWSGPETGPCDLFLIPITGQLSMSLTISNII